METYMNVDTVPLSYVYPRNGVRVSGMTVTVQAINAKDGSTMLAPTACPELGTSGVYTFMWQHGQIQDTLIDLHFVASGAGVSRTKEDSILLKFGPVGGRGV
jgi:hypothetical protein